jgi:hypothetical protein
MVPMPDYRGHGGPVLMALPTMESGPTCSIRQRARADSIRQVYWIRSALGAALGGDTRQAGDGFHPCPRGPPNRPPIKCSMMGAWRLSIEPAYSLVSMRYEASSTGVDVVTNESRRASVSSMSRRVLPDQMSPSFNRDRW